MDGIYRTRESGDSERTGLSSQGLREGGRDLRIGRGASRRGQGLKERDRDSEKGDISGIGMGTQRGDWGLETGVKAGEDHGCSDRGCKLQKARELRRQGRVRAR